MKYKSTQDKNNLKMFSISWDIHDFIYTNKVQTFALVARKSSKICISGNPTSRYCLK